LDASPTDQAECPSHSVTLADSVGIHMPKDSCLLSSCAFLKLDFMELRASSYFGNFLQVLPVIEKQKQNKIVKPESMQMNKELVTEGHH
jgi:hypothetical protein